MADDPEKLAARLRSGAERILGGADALEHRAEELPQSLQRHMLKLQADILREGAAELKDRALAVQPPAGCALAARLPQIQAHEFVSVEYSTQIAPASPFR